MSTVFEPPREHGTGDFVVVGTSHRRASVDLREALAARDEARRRFLSLALSGETDREHVLMSTCNRVEVWSLAGIAIGGAQACNLDASFGAAPGTFYVHRGTEAIAHAIRVASGLDSLAWGEPQVATQVREALVRAEKEGTARRGLPALVRKALAAAGRVRAAAGLPAGSHSASDAAVNLVLARFPGDRPSVLVVGTGKIGRLAARRLATLARLTVADRDPSRAAALAAELGAAALGLQESLDVIGGFDAILVATAAPRAVFTAASLSEALRGHATELLVVDLSVPRNVEPAVGRLPRIELVNIDGLQEWAPPVDPAAVDSAEATAWDEAERLGSWLRALPLESTIAQLRERAEAIRRQELASAERRLDSLPQDERAVLEKLTERIVNRLLHDPTEGLRRLGPGDDGEAADRLLRRLFRLEGP